MGTVAERRTAFGWALATLLIVALAAALVPSAAAAAKKPQRGPKGLAFYDTPKTSQLPKGHGKLIWYRKAGGLVPLKGAAWNKNVLYTSKSPQRERIGISGTVSVPKGKVPKGGWPVITYDHGTTGVADVCAPSRNSNTSPAKDYISYVNPILTDWLKAGYAVVRTDYQGLGTPGPHPYLIGKSEARSSLDILRAARQLDPDISKRYVIAGHSQGGQAALFSGGFANSWTPELKLRGTMAYAPASHMKTQAQALPALTSPSSLTALATMIFYGATTANGGVVPEQQLTDPVLALYPQLDQTCLPQLGASDKLGGIAPADMLRKNANVTDLYKVLDKNNPDVTTGAPVLLLQGEADTTVFPVFTNQLSKELEASGDDLDYVTYPGVDHSGIVYAGEPQAMKFLKANLPVRR